MRTETKTGKRNEQEKIENLFQIPADDLKDYTLMSLLQLGASTLLKEAVQEEITQYLGRKHYRHHKEDQNFKGYRNGTRRTRIDTPNGQVEYDRQLLVHAPDYQSKFHTPYMRRPKEFANQIMDMYVHGVSTRKVKKALQAAAGEKIRLQKSTVSRITKKLRDEFETWKKRNLKELKVAYLFLDAIHLGMRLTPTPKEAVLIAHAVLEDGTLETLSIGIGNKESNRSWGGFLEDLKRRGLGAPILIVSDGNQGVINAIESHYPESHRQRCTKHKTQNVLDKVPKEDQKEVYKDLKKIFYGATSLEQAKQAVNSFRKKYKKIFPSAVDCLETDLDQCLTFFLFPANHWKRMRTSNCLERMNLEIRRRLNVIGRHSSELGCLSLVYKITQEYSEGKRSFLVSDLTRQLWKRLKEKKKEMIEQLELELYAA